MRKKIIPRILLWVGIPVMFFTSCVDDKYLLNPPAVPNQSFVEEFDTLQSAHARGWRFVNRSTPLGPVNWIQAYSNFTTTPLVLVNGGADLLLPYSSTGVTGVTGNELGYITSNAYASAGTTPAGTGVISNWVVSPSLIMKNGDKIVFYTTSFDSLYAYDPIQGGVTLTKDADAITRLQVRINPHSDAINCGTGEDPGQFDAILLDINASEAPYGFPYYSLNGWTRFEATVYGLQEPRRGRFAFRYFVHAGGPDPVDEFGGSINLDKVSYISAK